MVQSGGVSRPVACLYHTQLNHGRARGTLTRRTPPPPEDNIPTSVPPSQIDDSIPTEEEVKWEVQRLGGRRSGGTSRMRDEHLWEWLQ